MNDRIEQAIAALGEPAPESLVPVVPTEVGASVVESGPELPHPSVSPLVPEPSGGATPQAATVAKMQSRWRMPPGEGANRTSIG